MAIVNSTGRLTVYMGALQGGEHSCFDTTAGPLLYVYRAIFIFEGSELIQTGNATKKGKSSCILNTGTSQRAEHLGALRMSRP